MGIRYDRKVTTFTCIMPIRMRELWYRLDSLRETFYIILFWLCDSHENPSAFRAPHTLLSYR